MIKVNIQIHQTGAVGTPPKSIELSTQEFIQLRSLINDISETIEIKEEQPKCFTGGFISGSELEKIFNNFKQL